MYCKINFVKKIFILLVCLFCFSGVYAQSADVITQIINASEVTYGQVCYLSAVHQKLIKDNSSMKDAVSALYNAGQSSEEYDANEPAKLNDIACIYMKMWPDEKAGIMFRVTGGSKRYAYKYLKDMGIILASSDATQYVTGREALNILTACMVEFAPEEEGMNMKIEE